MWSFASGTLKVNVKLFLDMYVCMYVCAILCIHKHFIDYWVGTKTYPLWRTVHTQKFIY